jgi:hypothetical protein
MVLNVTLIAEPMMDRALVHPVENDTTIDLRPTRTTGEWARPALAKVTAEPLDLTDDGPATAVRPGLLARTLSLFTR